MKIIENTPESTSATEKQKKEVTTLLLDGKNFKITQIRFKIIPFI